MCVCVCVCVGLMSTPPCGGPGNVFGGKTSTALTRRFDHPTDPP